MIFTNTGGHGGISFGIHYNPLIDSVFWDGFQGGNVFPPLYGFFIVTDSGVYITTDSVIYLTTDTA